MPSLGPFQVRGTHMGLAWPVLPYHPLPNSSVLALEFCRRDKQIIALKSTERLPLYLSISIQLQNPKLLGGGRKTEWL